MTTVERLRLQAVAIQLRNLEREARSISPALALRIAGLAQATELESQRETQN